MKNLIERIEELLKTARNYHRNYSDRDILSETRGQIEAYQDCLDVLTQYNIITAPKQIKLSEIVSRLQPLLDYPIYVAEVIVLNNKAVVTNVKYNNDLMYRNHIIDFEDNQIWYIHLPKEEKFKWLYTLWIAGTEIVDDLEGDE